MNKSVMREATRGKIADRSLGDKVHSATLRTVDKRAHLLEQLPEWEELRSRARAARMRALDHHAQLLERFETALSERGVHVHHAADSQQACSIITALVREVGTRVTKSKSMTSEEVNLNASLESAGIEVTETDLGELIVQLAGQPPSHVTAPAIHLSIEDIARIFRDKLGMVVPDWVDLAERADEDTRRSLARELSLEARRALRERFLGADVGISGANFLVAETGTLVLVENEGNIQLTTCLPKRHIVLAGIDKLIDSEQDLAVLLRVLPVSATAQWQSCYVSLLADAHPDMHVVLLDHGRRALLEDAEQRDLLACIRCGACMNACPVYRNVGGHAYGGAYPGPIGALLMPHLEGIARFGDLAFASTLCGACTDACPVAIPLHEHLLESRRRVIEAGGARDLGLTLRVTAQAMSNGARLQRAASLARFAMPFASLSPAVRAWKTSRDLPRPADMTFHTWWRRERGSEHRVPMGPSLHPQIEPLPEHRDELPAPPEDRDLVTMFVERIIELGPSGETEIHQFAASEQALGFLREQKRESSDQGALVEGDVADKRQYAVGITTGSLGIAATGGIVLDLADRRADWLSVLVDTHIVVLRPEQLVSSVEEALERRHALRARGSWGDFQVIVTGPSRTADVEKVLVIPAHGPRRLVVVLCEQAVDLGVLRRTDER